MDWFKSKKKEKSRIKVEKLLLKYGLVRPKNGYHTLLAPSDSDWHPDPDLVKNTGDGRSRRAHRSHRSSHRSHRSSRRSSHSRRSRRSHRSHRSHRRRRSYSRSYSPESPEISMGDSLRRTTRKINQHKDRIKFHKEQLKRYTNEAVSPVVGTAVGTVGAEVKPDRYAGKTEQEIAENYLKQQEETKRKERSRARALQKEEAEAAKAELDRAEALQTKNRLAKEEAEKEEADKFNARLKKQTELAAAEKAEKEKQDRYIDKLFEYGANKKAAEQADKQKQKLDAYNAEIARLKDTSGYRAEPGGLFKWAKPARDPTKDLTFDPKKSLEKYKPFVYNEAKPVISPTVAPSV